MRYPDSFFLWEPTFVTKVYSYSNSEGSEPRSQPTVTTESMKSELYVGQNIDPNPIIFVKVSIIQAWKAKSIIFPDYLLQKVKPVQVVEMRIDDYEATVYVKYPSLPIV